MINELGNPFLCDDSDELVALDTRNVLDESVVNTVRTVHSLGKDQYAKYCKEVITDCIHEPIKKNALRSSKTQEEENSENLFPRSDAAATINFP